MSGALDLAKIEALMVRAVSVATRVATSCRSDGTRGKAADARVSAAMRVVLNAMPHIVQICEEVPSSHHSLAAEGVAFLIDPIDGTDGFDRGAAEYAHMVALISEGKPSAAALACPGYGWLFSGHAGQGVIHERQLALDGGYSQPRALVRARTDILRAIVGQSELTEVVLTHLAELGADSVSLTDSAVAFGHVLRGEVDLFLRTKPSREWDIAAGHALLEITGGTIRGLDGTSVRYGKPGLLNGGFVAYAVAP